MDRQGRPKPGQRPSGGAPGGGGRHHRGHRPGRESLGFEQSGVLIQRGGTLLAGSDTKLPDLEGVFAGGDCVTGPPPSSGPLPPGRRAANIDEYLGFHHEITSDGQVPAPRFSDLRPRGRVNTTEREACERKHDFTCIECGLTAEEAEQESSRCLRCDHFGYGVFKGRTCGKMVNAIIDGRSVSVQTGTTILDAAQAAGIPIPHLCYLKDINEIAACRMCVVEIDGIERLVTACDNEVYWRAW